jgi:hypothetical protein
MERSAKLAVLLGAPLMNVCREVRAVVQLLRRTVCVARFGRTEMTSSISSYSSPAGSAQLLGCPDAEDRCVCAGTDKRVLDHYHDGGDDGEDPRPEPALPGFRCIRWDGGYALPAPLILMNGSPLLTSEL